MAVTDLPAPKAYLEELEAWADLIFLLRVENARIGREDFPSVWLGFNVEHRTPEAWYADAGEEPSERQVSGATRAEALQRLADAIREEVAEQTRQRAEEDE